MDILANFNWDRPLYFSKSSGPDAYFGLEEYFQLDGMAYRLVPIKSQGQRLSYNERVNTTTLPNKLLNVFPNHARVDVVNNPERAQKPVAQYLWGGINDKRVYHSDETARMYGALKSLYIRTANQLIEEGNIEKAEQLHDKLLEIFNLEIIPCLIVGNSSHTYQSTLQVESLLKLKTPTSNEKALKIAGKMLNEFKETFNWFNSANDRTLAIQNENISICIQFLSILTGFLSEEHQLLLKDKFKQINLTKALTSYASQISSEIDIYIKKGADAQRQLVEKMSELVRLNDIAALVFDQILEDNITRLLEEKIKMISAIDPQGGMMFRNYFLPEKEELE
jgi:hypothetical protein